MATPVILPKQGNTVESCIIQQWHKQPGDVIAEGEVLCEAETDKAVIEVLAPAAGTLLGIFFAVDDDVPVMTTIAAIGEAGEDVADLRPEAGENAAPPAAPADPADQTPARPGPAVAVPTGAALPAGQAPAAASGGAGSSPRARGLAECHGIDLTTVTGSGPEGRIIERDVQAIVDAAPPLSDAARRAVAAGAGTPPARGSGPAGTVLVDDLGAALGAPAPAEPGAYEDVPVRSLRKIVAERMRASLAEHAQLTINRSFRATALQRYRALIKPRAAAGELPNITLGDMLIFAVSRVLPRHPLCNAHFLGDTIRRFADVNLGVAVDTPRGLTVPVIARAQTRSLAAIAAEFKPLAMACQDGTVDPDLLAGGTFTVTNLGAMGIDDFTPVLNAPEVAILGAGGIHLRPYQDADGVEFVPTMTLSLTIDHQALDGADGARFLQELCQELENFETLLAS